MNGRPLSESESDSGTEFEFESETESETGLWNSERGSLSPGRCSRRQVSQSKFTNTQTVKRLEASQCVSKSTSIVVSLSVSISLPP